MNTNASGSAQTVNDSAHRAAKIVKRIFVAILFLFVCVGIAAAVVCMTVILPPKNRQQALDRYAPMLDGVRAGNTILFGTYEQDNDLTNGAEPIEWEVLAVQEGRYMLISKEALACARYNDSEGFVTWSDCSLNLWLNDEFYHAAFDGAERTMIQSSVVSPDRNPFFDTDPGPTSTDHIFLLSIEEASRFFPKEEVRRCVPTAYAVASGVTANVTIGTCNWWLRTPGFDNSVAARVRSDGQLNYSGYRVHSDFNAVRPVLWIALP